MRTVLLAAGTLFLINVTAQSGSVKQGNTAIVPPVVEQKFVLEHPDSKAVWETEGSNFRAKFINPVNNLGYITVYDPQGNIIRREREMETDEVPAKVATYMQKNTRGQGFVVWSVVDSVGSLSYYSPRPEGTIVFDKSGLPISEINFLQDTIVPASAR